ncbi:Sugar transporter ERD6-like 18 [Vitis vinifera]|uniref:Sugar transporter ERD6-like 18 n=1 Tax=Vitis vinifera TaxID=29760 RepID=A0A438KC13_VITVI|nr:Sugar transporter ERD6-like 18 [Vitis vinifera]
MGRGCMAFSDAQVGGIVGALISGTTADLIGRRGTMWFADIFCIMGWLLIAFAKDYWWLDFGRLATGFGVGLISYVAAVYISEIAPTNIRGGFTSVVRCFLAHLGYYWSCSMCITGHRFILSSRVSKMAKVGREKELEASLGRLRGERADITQEAADIIEYTKIFLQFPKATILDVFQRRYASFTHCWSWLDGADTIFRVTANRMLYEFHLGVSWTRLNVFLRHANIVLQIPVTAVSVVLIDKSGRRPLLMVSAAGMGLSSLLIGFSFLLQDLNQLKEVTPIVVLIGLLTYSATNSLGMAGLPWLIMAEIYPINIKGVAGSLVIFSNWFFSWVVTYTFNYMFDWELHGNILLLLYNIGFHCSIHCKLVPETKGRKLEEIQASMTHFLR